MTRDTKKANSRSLTDIGKERRWVPIPTTRKSGVCRGPRGFGMTTGGGAASLRVALDASLAGKSYGSSYAGVS